MSRICMIVLAGGEGSRFGGPKALAKWKEGTLLSHALSLAPRYADVVVVTGAHHKQLKSHLQGHDEAYNRDWSLGMGTSIATGILAASLHDAEIALIVPVDQPFITAAHLLKLATQAKTEDRCILTRDEGIIGPPAAVPARFFTLLGNLTEGGIKSIVHDYGQCSGTGMLRDVDTQDDLKRFAQH